MNPLIRALTLLLPALLPLALGAQTITTITLDGGTQTDVGRSTSHAIVDGKPAISYHDVSNGDLKYVRASDATGTTWGAPVIVDSSGRTGLFTSLVVISGIPAISYYDASNRDLRCVRALDTGGANWGPR